MMRGILKAAAAAAFGSFVALSPAKAAVTIYDIAVIAPPSATYAGLADGPGAFLSYVKFQLATAVTGSISYSNTALAGLGITGGVLSLNSCSTDCTGTAVAPTGSVISSTPVTDLFGGTVQISGVGPTFFAAGSYFIGISGSIPAAGTDIPYTGTITVAAVPEPGTWAMMLLGFLGLAFASTRRKKAAAAV
jgi:hypothetical protein